MSDWLKMPCCHGNASKSYHRQHKIFECQWCARFGGFTPFSMEHFAPFSSTEDALSCQRDMIEYFSKLPANIRPNVQTSLPKGWSMN